MDKMIGLVGEFGGLGAVTVMTAAVALTSFVMLVAG